MTNQQHPITPPDELLEQWYAVGSLGSWHNALTLAARWGADQELEAFQSWLTCKGYHSLASDLLALRRRKPPSLKEQALDELDLIPTHDNEGRTVGVDVSIIRRALEALPND